MVRFHWCFCPCLDLNKTSRLIGSHSHELACFAGVTLWRRFLSDRIEAGCAVAKQRVFAVCAVAAPKTAFGPPGKREDFNGFFLGGNQEKCLNGGV